MTYPSWRESAGDEPSRTLYSIGHGARKSEDFMGLLARFKIEVLVDIRRWPTSKIIWFRKDELENKLGEYGMEYIWMGEKLGGYRSGGYERYMATKEFLTGLGQLEDLAHRKLCCIMCLEISPRGCHRRFVSHELVRKGWTVLHIFTDRRVEEHRSLFKEEVGLKT